MLYSIAWRLFIFGTITFVLFTWAASQIEVQG